MEAGMQVDDKQGIVQITATGGVNIDVQWVQDFHRWAVLQDHFFFHLDFTGLDGHRGLTSLVVLQQCFPL